MDRVNIEEFWGVGEITLPAILSFITILGYLDQIFEEDGPFHLFGIIGVAAIINAVTGEEMPFVNVLITAFILQYFYVIIA